MPSIEAVIPLKRRLDALEALEEAGMKAEIQDPREGSLYDRCVVIVGGGTKDAKSRVHRVLENLGITQKTEK
jgi:hypothetical protein